MKEEINSYVNLKYKYKKKRKMLNSKKNKKKMMIKKFKKKKMKRKKMKKMMIKMKMKKKNKKKINSKMNKIMPKELNNRIIMRKNKNRRQLHSKNLSSKLHKLIATTKTKAINRIFHQNKDHNIQPSKTNFHIITSFHYQTAYLKIQNNNHQINRTDLTEINNHFSFIKIHLVSFLRVRINQL